MRFLLLPDPVRADRTATFAALAAGLRRLDQDVHVADCGLDHGVLEPTAMLALRALGRRPLRIDAFGTRAPDLRGLAPYGAWARTLGLPRVRIDARGFDFVICPAELPVVVMPRRGQRTIVLAGDIAPLPRAPVAAWAKTLRPCHELVFPTRAEWHRALAEAPHLVRCATRVIGPVDGAAGWGEDPVVHFARRVIGFVLSPSSDGPWSHDSFARRPSVTSSAGKKSSSASSDSVTSTGVPNTVTVVMKERSPAGVRRRSVAATSP